MRPYNSTPSSRTAQVPGARRPGEHRRGAWKGRVPALRLRGRRAVPAQRQPWRGSNGALYIMVRHLMVRYIVSIRHFLTLYSVNKTLFDTIFVAAVYPSGGGCDFASPPLRAPGGGDGPWEQEGEARDQDHEAPVVVDLAVTPALKWAPRIHPYMRVLLMMRTIEWCAIYNGAPFTGALYSVNKTLFDAIYCQ